MVVRIRNFVKPVSFLEEPWAYFLLFKLKIFYFIFCKGTGISLRAVDLTPTGADVLLYISLNRVVELRRSQGKIDHPKFFFLHHR